MSWKYLKRLLDRLTIHTSLNLGDDLKLRDDSGAEHPLATSTVTAMMAIGWAAFFLAWIINVAFYVVWQHYHSCFGGFSKHFLCRSIPLEWTWSPADTRTSSPPMFWGRRGESWDQRWMDEVNYYIFLIEILIYWSPIISVDDEASVDKKKTTVWEEHPPPDIQQ